MGDGDQRIVELRGRVRVAVEREQAAGADRARRQRVVDVLARGIAVDLDRDAGARGLCEYRVPVGRDARARAVLPPARMAQDVNAAAS